MKSGGRVIFDRSSVELIGYFSCEFRSNFILAKITEYISDLTLKCDSFVYWKVEPNQVFMIDYRRFL